MTRFIHLFSVDGWTCGLRSKNIDENLRKNIILSSGLSRSINCLLNLVSSVVIFGRRCRFGCDVC